jgi:site-specific DNA-methyltransferase (adenine-specific)
MVDARRTETIGDATLYLGDCLEILPTLEAGSVDAIITDLPYGTTSCSWDTVIPFGPMWSEARRVMNDDSVFVTTAAQPFTSALVMSNLDWFRQELIWDKVLPVGFLDANRRHLRRHENIIIFSPNGYPTYNPQMERRGKPRGKGGPGRVSDVYHKYGPRKSCNNEYYPTTIITASNGDHTREELEGHPTQKPLRLLLYLLNTFTDGSYTVLDFCMGSGTTGVAALRLGRRFIGIEIEPKYFDIACRRIEQENRQLKMF